MNLGEIFETLMALPCDKVELVTIKGTKSSITGFDSVGSWRGSYDEPCIFRGGNYDKYLLLFHLRQLLTEKYTGWKGGTYWYTPESPLHIEDYAGSYSGEHEVQSVKHIEDRDVIQIVTILE